VAAGGVAFFELGLASAASIAGNGDFETGDTSGWAYFPSPDSTFAVTADSQAGAFAAELRNLTLASAAVIKQANIGIGSISPGDTIEITFFAKGLGEVGGVLFAEVFSEITGGGNSASVILGGAPLGLTNNYQPFTFTTTAGPDVSGGVTLQFAAVTGAAAGSNIQAFIDGVEITNLSAVPEPTSSLLTGLFGLMMIARRRR
jgi:hypothetical protein